MRQNATKAEPLSDSCDDGNQVSGGGVSAGEVGRRCRRGEVAADLRHKLMTDHD